MVTLQVTLSLAVRTLVGVLTAWLNWPAHSSGQVKVRTVPFPVRAGISFVRGLVRCVPCRSSRRNHGSAPAPGHSMRRKRLKSVWAPLVSSSTTAQRVSVVGASGQLIHRIFRPIQAWVGGPKCMEAFCCVRTLSCVPDSHRSMELYAKLRSNPTRKIVETSEL